jgi:RNA polymerase sigma factor (sigma-70 family)
MNEAELLLAFRKERSEEAFAELVRRYASLVYSVAKRRLGDAAMAEDITQIVFIRLAKTPPTVENHGELVAWLHRTTINITIDTWRSETRRRNREQQATFMEPATPGNPVWEEISPHLDEALNQLDDVDRQALLLRFFGRKTMRDLGIALGVSEDAAKMRVSRAVDRLRTQLRVGGAACTAAVLGTMLTDHSVEAAPSQLVSRLSAMRSPALVELGPTGGLVGAFLRMSRLQLAVGAVGLALIAVCALYLHRSWSSPVLELVSQSPNGSTGTPGEAASRLRRETNGFNPSAPLTTKALKTLFHVLDADTGLGLAQAQLHFAFFGPGGEGESHDILTDNNGDAPIQEPDDSTKNGGPNVFVTADGHVPKVVGFHSGAVPADYTIRLDPAMTVGGMVVDEQGLPVAGVKILVQAPGNKPGQIENVDFQTCPITNREDGSWSCSYVPRDYTNEIRFILEKPGYAATCPVVPVAQVDLRNLVLVISRGFAITGRVTDAQGQPVVAGDINTLNGDHNTRQSGKTDEQGYFILLGVAGETAPGVLSQVPPLATNEAGAVSIRGIVGQGVLRAELSVQAKGFASQTKQVELLDATNVANFSLSQGKSFRGQVVDEAGNPISNAVVRTDYDFQNQVEPPFEWKTHTDVNGRFEWDSAPAQEICYWFEAEGYKRLRGLRFSADGTEHEITLHSNGAK